jgi:predicted nuclease with TOPRIM domain
LKSVATSRYELHSLFVEEYKELATYQKELYEMLSTENTEITELKEQVKKVNAQNEVVQTAIDIFNKATVDVNELKDEVISGLQDHN